MSLKNSIAKQLKTIKRALELGNITAIEAEPLIEAVAFMFRQSDYFAFCEYYFAEKFTTPHCELHQCLIDVSEDPLTALMAPRGHGKTIHSCVSIPLFLALNKPGKYRHFLNIQASTEKAVAVNLAIRAELESNELLRADYGCQVTTEKWTERQFVLANGTIFTAIGAGQSIRGLNYRNIRPDFINCDDLYDEECVWSPHQVRRINSWFWSSVFKCVASDRPSCIHIRGTAISREDLMHLLAKRERWTSRKFQAVLDWDKGEVLWPQNPNCTIDKLKADKEDMGSSIFEREMQNEIRDDETSIIKMGWIQTCSELPITREQAEEIQRRERLTDIPEYITRIVGAVDPAEKTKEHNDFTGKAVCLESSLGNKYFVYLGNEKLSIEQNKRDVIALHERYKMTVCFFETNQAYALYKEIQRVSTVPLKEIITTKDKLQRLESVQALFENGKVFFYNRIQKDLLNEAIDQLTTNHPPHDDVRDAIVLCLEQHGSKKFMFA